MSVNLYDPRTLGAAIRVVPRVATFFRDTFFRTEKTFSTKGVDVDFYKGRRQLAPFVNPRLPGRAVEHRGYKTNYIEPAHISPFKPTTIDQLLNRSMGEDLYSGKTPAQRAAERLGEDLAELDEMIVRREEWMCVQAIVTGKIPLIGEGVNLEVDFQFTNKETLSGSDLWSADTSDPIAYLKQAQQKCQKEGYRTPNIAIFASNVADAFIRHPKVKELLDIRNIQLAVIEPKVLSENVRYIGYIAALNLSIYEYNEWYLDDWTNPAQPAEKPLIPDGTIVLASTNARYSLYYGAITLVNESSKGFVTVEGKRVPDTWVTKNPDQRFLRIQSTPIPVPHEVDSWHVAKVL